LPLKIQPLKTYRKGKILLTVQEYNQLDPYEKTKVLTDVHYACLIPFAKSRTHEN